MTGEPEQDSLKHLENKEYQKQKEVQVTCEQITLSSTSLSTLGMKVTLKHLVTRYLHPRSLKACVSSTRKKENCLCGS